MSAMGRKQTLRYWQEWVKSGHWLVLMDGANLTLGQSLKRQPTRFNGGN